MKTEAYEPNPSSRSTTLLLRFAIALMGSVLVADLAAILFVSGYFNYGAEGIEIAALLRMADGLPYITRLPDIPWYVNQYSPYFYAAVGAPLQLFDISSLHATALFGRLFVLAAAFALLLCAYRHFRRSLHVSRAAFVFVSAWFLLLFPANIGSVRPDFPAFLLEFLAFVMWQKSDDSSHRRLWRVGLAGLIFGSALALKLNTIGVVAGLLAFEVTERRWCRAFALGGATAMSTLLYLALSWKIWGADALRDTFLALQNQLEAPSELANRLIMLIFYAAPLSALATLGLRRLRIEGAAHTRALVFVVFVSALIATLQQAKAGAWYNYYYGAFALALGPAAYGLDALLRDATRNRTILVVLLGVVLVHTAWAFRVATVVARDRFLGRYPFAEAKTWCERELSPGAIYSDDPNVLLHFRDRALLGSNAEIILNLTPALRPFVPALLTNMRTAPYVAAIATGPACADWKPNGVFRTAIAHLTRLEAQFGWICVFVPSKGST